MTNNLFILRANIEQFLQQSDNISVTRFINWLKHRLRLADDTPVTSTDLSRKPLINTTQMFACRCGHRYSLGFAITDLLLSNDDDDDDNENSHSPVHSSDNPIDLENEYEQAAKRSNTENRTMQNDKMKENHRYKCSTCSATFRHRQSLEEHSRWSCSNRHFYPHHRQSISTNNNNRRSYSPSIHDREMAAVKLLICTQCQIRLHTRETFLNHYSMHQQGYAFCKSCFEFYKPQIDPISEQSKLHDCEQRKHDRTLTIDEPMATAAITELEYDEKSTTTGTKVAKLDELHSLEQLIPPDTTDQQQQQEENTTNNGQTAIDNLNDQETSASARIIRFGLPKLTDSIVEIIRPDGKRQFRCPLCFNSYANRSGLNRHYITHSSQDLWKVECKFCGKRYSRKDSLKHHMKTQHAHFALTDPAWGDMNGVLYQHATTPSSYHEQTNNTNNNRSFHFNPLPLISIEDEINSPIESISSNGEDVVLVT